MLILTPMKRTDRAAEGGGGREYGYVPPSVPGWARLHNPALLGGLAVVEFSVDVGGGGPTSGPGVDSPSLACMPSRRLAASSATDANSGGPDSKTPSTLRDLLLSPRRELSGRHAVPFLTNLFQGPRPRSATDCLMYVDPTPPPKPHPRPPPPRSDTGRALSLEPLLLKRAYLGKFGYPRLSRTKKGEVIPPDRAPADAERAVKARDVVRRRMSAKVAAAVDDGGRISSPFSADEATALVRDIAVRVASEDGDDGGDSSEGDGCGDSPESDKSDGGREDREGGAAVPIPREVYVSTAPPLNDNGSRTGGGGGGTTPPRVFALDCEMVRTSSLRPELARVTLLRYDPSPPASLGDGDPNRYVVVLDELVKPRRIVLDHLTRYSGVTAKALANVTTRIEQVQASLAGLIQDTDIIVGHSLENDLRALRLVHEKVVDTACLFRSKDGRKHCELYRDDVPISLPSHILSS